MADRRDKLVFQPLGLGQVLGHLVDGLAQAANFIIVSCIRKADFHVTLGNFRCGGFHLTQGAHDGAHKKQAAPDGKGQHQHAQANADGNGAPPPRVHQREACHHPHGGDAARRVGHEHRHGHDAFAVGRCEDGRPHAVGRGKRPAIVGAVGQVAAHGAAAGRQNDALAVQQHELELVLLVELLNHAAQGLAAAFGSGRSIPRRAGGLQAAHDGGKTAFHRTFHPAVEVIVAVIQEQPLGNRQHQHGDEQAAAYPAADDTARLHEGGLLSGWIFWGLKCQVVIKARCGGVRAPLPTVLMQRGCDGKAAGHRGRRPLRQRQGGCAAARGLAALRKQASNPYYAFHRYPYPHTVMICWGLLGSSSIFMRRRRMFTSTIFTSPK